MLKRLIFYFLGFIVLASLAYYGFGRWQASKSKVDLWAIVPESAAIVVETNNHQALAGYLTKTELWQSMEVLPVMLRFQENMAVLDSVSPGKQRLTRFLDEKNILTSVHVSGESDVDFVFYIPVNSVGEHRFLRTLTENVTRNSAFEQESRQYDGVLLTQVTSDVYGVNYTYFSYHNNIVLSSSPLLIEEVVRRINLKTGSSIVADFKTTNYLDQPDVYANVYVNYRELPALLALFLKEDIMPQVRYLSSLCRNGMLELKLDKGKFFLNGFSNPEPKNNSLHSNLALVKPKPIEVKDFLPVRTAAMLHFGAEQLAGLKQQPKPSDNTTIDSLAATFKHELALVYLEARSARTSPEKILFARTVTKPFTRKLLLSLNARTAKTQKVRPHTETYGGYVIREILVPELPAKLFGDLFSGFKETYAVELGNYILFADELSTARALIDDVLADKVWGKSATQQAFQEETLQEANFSFFLNTVNAWYILNRYTTDEERESLLQASSFIKGFNQVGLQFAKVEGQYYTSILIRKQDGSNGAADGGFTTAFTIPFSSRIISRPYPVFNTIDRTPEVIVQDSAFILSNITANGRRAWSDTLRSSVRGTIKQLPLGSEKRLRHLFSTTTRIHAIDNQAQQLVNFPFNLPDSLDIQRLTIFDYDKSGNYNLLVDDAAGNLYMYDIRGNAVTGWQPRRLEYKLAAEAQHLRVGVRDVILAVLENGYVYAMNKNGDTYQGFPFSLRSPVTSGAVVTLAAADMRKTELTAVTKYGEVITFNLQGRILRREQLPRPSKSAMFELVQSEGTNSRAFVYVRQDQGKVAIFDQDNDLLLEKRFVTSALKQVQYFNFGGDNIIFAITETGPQKTYLYDGAGKLVGNQPLSSSQPVTIFQNENDNSFSLYKVYRRELEKLNFRLKR